MEIIWNIAPLIQIGNLKRFTNVLNKKNADNFAKLYPHCAELIKNNKFGDYVFPLMADGNKYHWNDDETLFYEVINDIENKLLTSIKKTSK